MSIVYERYGVTVYHGDCLDILPTLPDNSIDAVITDPPYGIRFMGKAWDGLDIERGVALRRSQAPMPDDGKAGANGGYQSAAAEAGRYDLSLTANQAFELWCQQWATECLRVLKPGGHLAAFGSPRTAHRLTAGIEDAGFEIRDGLTWLYGSGFPKSLDVSKAIDKAAGAEREVIGEHRRHGGGSASSGSMSGDLGTASVLPLTAPATDEAARWQGWGTALKPAQEPIVLARKPLSGTVAANVLEHGTGGLNIDDCRISHASAADLATSQSKNPGRTDVVTSGVYGADRPQQQVNTEGRWPANVLLTHADECAAVCVSGCPVAELDQQSGTLTTHAGTYREDKSKGTSGWGMRARKGHVASTGDSGGASRFFPVFRWEAKAPTSERPQVAGVAHPTVKPIDLMRWLVRLVTPPGGVVLDLFAGTGTTLQAARAEGFRAVGIEREQQYIDLIRARLDARPRQAEAAVAVVDDGPLDLFDLLDEGRAS